MSVQETDPVAAAHRLITDHGGDRDAAEAEATERARRSVEAREGWAAFLWATAAELIRTGDGGV